MTASVRELIKRAEKELVMIRDNINLGHYTLAVSRGYFMMFYLAEAILMSEGKSFSSHQAVISALGRDFVATGKFSKHLHQYFHQAQEKRLISDYTIPFDFSQDDAEEQLRHAQEFLAGVKQFFQGRE